MQDERGQYYHARAGDSSERVYVRRGNDGEVEFRLWNRDKPEIWENHGWVAMAAIREAAAMYRQLHPNGRHHNILELYDLNIARTLLDRDNS